MQANNDNNATIAEIALEQLTYVTGGDGSPAGPPPLPQCPSGTYPDQTYIQGNFSVGGVGLGTHSLVVNQCLPVPK